MTALGERIAARIAAGGPIPLADYMTACLHDPRDGYYATRDPLGAAGDFVTAPEISQMFGELLGLALAQAWLDQGAPGRILLAELGPGRGTMMQDVLRATRGVPGFADAAALNLVETSPALRRQQAERLPGATFHDRIDTLPEAPLFLLANEFFDALPVRQFVRDGAGWRERMVGLEEGRLAFGLGPAAPLEALAYRLDDTADGDLVEVAQGLPAIAGEIGRRLDAHGGAALIVDYGDWRSLGDTLQALAGHQRTDPLAAPGAADLTAHVDFEAIARAAAPAVPTRLVPQGTFLRRLGIAQRAEALGARLDGAAREAHEAAHRRLTLPGEMGLLFKAMGLTRHDAPPPPGFTR
ncbi:class I SAM-dependent methyltransferase [Wenxinia marina]|uniref:SAM-dependent methyltransferase, MidA family n=1 Tax=Wenxinia marina DSM 24838 TaxID=1123501 RepID=A0A0D0Q566_9RHOB|nr:SAM-dependent methyltransferase [Wenxinia marina]KIQ69644.1 hypothetical protein Wenmar_02008 [Wenxinia marina DSM 24838]GGL60005.1 ATP synthase subunit beta [Wenxinia marina]